MANEKQACIIQCIQLLGWPQYRNTNGHTAFTNGLMVTTFDRPKKIQIQTKLAWTGHHEQQKTPRERQNHPSSEKKFQTQPCSDGEIQWKTMHANDKAIPVELSTKGFFEIWKFHLHDPRQDVKWTPCTVVRQTPCCTSTPSVSSYTTKIFLQKAG